MFDDNSQKGSAEENNISSPDHFGTQKHKQIAVHLEESANYYREAARYREQGDLKRSHKCFVLALGHCCTARALMREEIKHSRPDNTLNTEE